MLSDHNDVEKKIFSKKLSLVWVEGESGRAMSKSNLTI